MGRCPLSVRSICPAAQPSARLRRGVLDGSFPQFSSSLWALVVIEIDSKRSRAAHRGRGVLPLMPLPQIDDEFPDPQGEEGGQEQCGEEGNTDLHLQGDNS
jgi:hypothetical protein